MGGGGCNTEKSRDTIAFWSHIQLIFFIAIRRADQMLKKVEYMLKLVYGQTCNKFEYMKTS
jgi:transcriptional regulator